MKSNIKILLLLIVGSITGGISTPIIAQVVTSIPAFPSSSNEVIITFNAAQGSGGLAGYTGDVYAHTGVITSNSTSSSDWKYVKTSWGENTPETKLDRTGQNTYNLAITPNVKDFYGVPDGETILSISLVLRSDIPVNGSYLEGKTDTNGDIFVDIFENNNLEIVLQQPTSPNIIASENADIPVYAQTSLPAKIVLIENQTRIDSVENATEYNYTLTAQVGGHFNYTILAEANGESSSVEFTYITSDVPNEANLPSEALLGPEWIGNNQIRLALEVPNKTNVLLHSNLTDWKYNADYWMNITPDRRYFWLDVDISSLNGTPFLYQFIVDEEIPIADPLSELILDRQDDPFIDSETFPNLEMFPEKALGNHVSVLVNEDYPWQVQDFQPVAQEKLIIYEILIRDFIASHNYRDLLDTLPYLKRLGINAIELMPPNEFEGNLSWGYNPSFQGAVDKYYGSPEQFKAFIDACHEMGIAVIMDVVFNHVFSQSPLAQLYWDSQNFAPRLDNPWLNVSARHPFNVGYDVNHEYQGTKDWMDRILNRWVDNYHIDGFRFDLSKGFTQVNNPNNVNAWGQYDGSRISLLKRLADQLWNRNPETIVILEHFANNIEEKELAEYGMLLWGNMNYNYTEAAMGYTQNSNLSSGLSSSRGWTAKHLITYMESHDEERMVYKSREFGNSSGDYSTQDETTSLERAALSSVFFYPLPGPKMIWQFEELGYSFSINRCENGTINDNCRLSPKPIRWDFIDDQNRWALYNVSRDLIYLKNNFNDFTNGTFTHQLGGAVKSYQIDGSEIDAVAIGNFAVESRTGTINFNKTGTWYNYFTGQEINVTDLNQPITLNPGEYFLYLDQSIEKPSTNPLVAISQIDRINLKIYPNPAAASDIFLQHSDFSFDVRTINLINNTGQIIQSIHYNDDPSAILKFTISPNTIPGMHVVQVITSIGVINRQIIIH